MSQFPYFSFLLSNLLISSLLLAAPPKAFQELPLVSKIWIGSENGLIISNKSEEIDSRSDAQILFLSRNQQWLEKGEHWATIAPKAIELERKAFELARDKAVHELSLIEDKRNERVLSLKLDIQTLKENEQKLSILLEQNQLPKKTRKLIRLSLSELKTQIAKLKEKLQPDKLDILTNLKKSEISLNLEKQEKVLNDLLQISELKAAFPGRLTLNFDSDQLNDISDGKSIWVKINTPFATITDDRHYNIELKPLAQNLYSPSPKNTTLLLGPLESGQMIRAQFKQFETSQSSPSLRKWIFDIHPDDIQYAPESVGLIRMAHLFKKLDKPCHVVLKKDIASSAPQILKDKGWEGLIKLLWPKANITFIGPQAIALTP